MIYPPIILWFFLVSSSLSAMDKKETLEENVYFSCLCSMTNIIDKEIEQNKNREYWLDKVHKGVSSLVTILPYAMLYYCSDAYPEYIHLIKYSFPPLTLLTYSLTLAENNKKTMIYNRNITQDIIPLRDLLPDLRRILECIEKDEIKQDLSVQNSNLLIHIESLNRDSPVEEFFSKVFSAAVREHRYNTELSKQRVGGDQKLRLVFIFSFLRLLDRSDKDYQFFCDTKPSLSIAAFDVWRVVLHSYPVLVSKCADELINNLTLLKESPENLRKTTNKPFLKTVVWVLSLLLEIEEQ